MGQKLRPGPCQPWGLRFWLMPGRGLQPNEEEAKEKAVPPLLGQDSQLLPGTPDVASLAM